MMVWVNRLASKHLTMLGMLLLAVGSALSYGGRLDVSMWVLVVPLLVLSLNLLAAIMTNRRINRQAGLLVFHLGLLGLVIVVAFGRLVHMDAQVEMIVGQGFYPELLHETKHGPLHISHLDEVNFIQGPYSVNYDPGPRRKETYSYAMVTYPDGHKQEIVFGDDKPLLMGNYRIYTSFNKGFTTILTWTPDGGESVTGSVNMPSFPLYDYKQQNTWTPPGTDDEIKFWLRLTTAYDESVKWVLEQKTSSGVLVVTVGDERVELMPGEEARLPAGTLRFDELTMWMGYTIFYDPTLGWLFWISVIAVLGLTWHLGHKIMVQGWSGKDDDDSVSASNAKV